MTSSCMNKVCIRGERGDGRRGKREGVGGRRREEEKEEGGGEEESERGGREGAITSAEIPAGCTRNVRGDAAGGGRLR